MKITETTGKVLLILLTLMLVFSLFMYGYDIGYRKGQEDKEKEILQMLEETLDLVK